MIMMNKDFAVFILTHGRADSVYTYNVLKNMNYKGKIYFIIDNLDSQRDQYIENFGKENVIIFDKKKVASTTDTMDNFNNLNAIVYARNESYNIARKLGLKYFLQLDDDYNGIMARVENNGILEKARVKDINKLFQLMINFLESTNVKTIAFAQGGDFIGGTESTMWQSQFGRKAMNSFFCKTDRPITFKGTQNEDVTTYTTYGQRGDLFFSIAKVMINQLSTQSLDGGMTELYRDGGTYIKSFYSVMSCPSAVKVSSMGNRFKRIHHKVFWNNVAPKILDEGVKK